MPTRKPKESAIEKYFVEQVESRIPGAQARKWKSRRNDPDRIVLFPNGTVAFVELKRPGEEPRDGQLREMDRLRKSKFYVFTLSTEESVDRWISDIW